MIGTPTLFVGDLLRTHPYDPTRRFSDDSELCERWTREFSARFAISNAYVLEVGKSSWDEVVVRCRMYGISDEEIFSLGRDSGWSLLRQGRGGVGPGVLRFGFEFQEQSVQASLTYLHDGALHLQVGATDAVLVFNQCDGGVDIQFAGQRHLAQIYRRNEELHVFTPHGATRILAIDLLDPAGATHGEGGRLTAPMPGKVLSFAVKAGDKVQKGQALAVMEAMKMEHTIAAPADGTVAELLYAPGDQVTEGSELLRMDA